MTDKSSRTASSPMKTVEQISAGGVAFRNVDGSKKIAVIRTTSEGRWQLPKGIIDAGETPERAAVREVREEAGIVCSVTELVDVIDYWFVASYDGERKRYHKYVHFFLMEYVSGDIGDHDHEVLEARWVIPAAALEMLAFRDEKQVVEKATAAMERRRSSDDRRPDA